MKNFGKKPKGNNSNVKDTEKPGMPRWATWAIIAVVVLLIAGPRLWPTQSATKFTYTEFLELVKQGQIKQVEINNLSNQISGTLKDGGEFVTTGAVLLSDADETLLKEKGVDYDYSTPQGNFFTNLIPLLLPFVLIMAFFFWMQKRAMGQAGSIMSIGRSRAKNYNADKPATTFADVAGYAGVKQEIREVSILENARELQRNRCKGAKGRAVGWASGHRQNPVRPRSRRRGWCWLLVGYGF